MNPDSCQSALHNAGWSIGDTAIRTATGVVWMVYGHRGEHRIVAKAPKLEDAWRLAAEIAHA
jgi:hypothetical protein